MCVLDNRYLLRRASADHFLAHSYSHYDHLEWFTDLVVHFRIYSLTHEDLSIMKVATRPDLITLYLQDSAQIRHGRSQQKNG